MPNRDYIDSQIQRLNESAERRDWRENDRLADELIDRLVESGSREDLDYVVESVDRMSAIVLGCIIRTLVEREGRVPVELAVRLFAHEMTLAKWDGYCPLMNYTPPGPEYEHYGDAAANTLMVCSDWDEDNVVHALPLAGSDQVDVRRAASIFIGCWMATLGNRFTHRLRKCLAEIEQRDDAAAQRIRSHWFYPDEDDRKDRER